MHKTRDVGARRFGEDPDAAAAPVARVAARDALGLAFGALPWLDFGPASLGIFAIFYGLDWIATVPPTVALATRAFGAREAPVVFGVLAAAMLMLSLAGARGLMSGNPVADLR